MKGAIFYHRNPDNFREVVERAKWIGSGKSFTATTTLKIVNLIKFFPLISVFKGIVTALRYKDTPFIIFKVIYDTAVWTAIFKNL